MNEKYYGRNCPVGMVQVEFVGCSPEEKNGEYGWKPTVSAFLEIYVDGVRFRIDVGSPDDGDKSKRGLHIIGPMDMEYTKDACNSCSITIPKKDATS